MPSGNNIITLKYNNISSVLIFKALVDDIDEQGRQVCDHEDAGELPGEDQIQGDHPLLRLIPQLRPVGPSLYNILTSSLRSQVSELRHLEVGQEVVRPLNIEIQRTDLLLERIGAHTLKETGEPDPLLEDQIDWIF